MILLCADPARVTGLAALMTTPHGDPLVFTMQARFTALPAPTTQVHEAAVHLLEMVYDALVGMAPDAPYTLLLENLVNCMVTLQEIGETQGEPA